MESPSPPSPIAVSVVIPVGSVDDQLPLQVRAILAQRAEVGFELVLSLNSSAPADRAAVGDLVRTFADPRLRMVSSADRRGAAHARNVGAFASEGRVLAFSDADDEVHHGWLAALLRGLEKWDAVTGQINEVAPPKQQAWRPPATPGRLPTFLGVPYILSGNLAITRKAFVAVGGFDETLTRCEDIALGWALLEKGYRIGYVEDAIKDAIGEEIASLSEASIEVVCCRPGCGKDPAALLIDGDAAPGVGAAESLPLRP